MANTDKIDVIVPVYRGLTQTRLCLESVLAFEQRTPFELVLIDDCSPEPELAEYLSTLSARGRAVLIKNEANLGFVASVNKGMALHPTRDVVLLNSDTEVANDWLDRLLRIAMSGADIGTVTPFSNNATICSYPYEGWRGGVPGTLGLAGLDILFATANAGVAVDLPTAVGFCMYIRRACLDAVGMFDETRFGRGYGEENDFSRRALAAGWRNVLAGDVFVYHEGAVSFSEARESLQKAAMAALLEVHPDYLDRVREFISRDPLAPLRCAVDRARSLVGAAEAEQVRLEHIPRSGLGRKPTQLHISHSWGGGTGRWVSDFCKGDEERQNLVLFSRSDRNNAGFRLELVDLTVSDSPMAIWELALPIPAVNAHHSEYRAILREIIERFGIGAILISSLVGHTLDALETGLPTVMVLHDLFPFCPAMFAYYRAPCAACSPEELQSCLHDNPFNQFWHNTQVEDWLRLRGELGERLRRPWLRLAAPSPSVRDRWISLMPALASVPWRFIGHGIDATMFRTGDGEGRAPVSGAKLRVVIPGRLSPQKGLDLLRDVLPGLLEMADLLLLGCGEYGRPFTGMPGIEVVPDYDGASLGREIRRFSPDCALLLSVLPESFSYTLSEMFALGVPVLATRLGAFSDRIEPGVTGQLFEPGPEALLACVREAARDRMALSRMADRLAARPCRNVRDMVRDYHALLPIQSIGCGGLLLEGMAEAARVREKLIQDNVWLWNEISRDRAWHTEETAGLRARVADLDGGISKLSASLKAIELSRSWRITAPLRKGTEVLRRGLRVVSWDRRASGEVSRSDAGVVDQPRVISLAQGSNENIRHEVRHNLGIPDATHIVFGFAPTKREATCLSKALSVCTAMRNDVCFVLFDDGMHTVDWNGEAEVAAVLQARRRVFVIGPDPRPEYWLLAADAFVMASDDGGEGENAMVALKSGLFLLSCPSIPHKTLRGSGQLGVISEANPSNAATLLSAWLDQRDDERARMVAETRALLTS